MSFLYSQLFKSLPYPQGSYAGKTVVITGSNVGLGKEAARHFARLGASKLILAVRSLDKGRVAKEDIEATTNCAKHVVEVWELDMSNTRPTFTITSSEVHGWTKFEQRNAPDGEIFNTINEEASKSSDEVGKLYPLSKLLEVLGVRTFAELHPASEYPVTVNNVNPGFCHSELTRDIQTWRMWLMKLFLARTTEYGSRTLVSAGSAGAESHGHYMSDCAVAEPAPFVTSKEGKEAQDRVWNELVQKLEAIQPGVMSKI
ncbi:short-chain dehydrogenase [Colletotrichum higginsianum]|nr:short-chain dehydrogenase [Colletotrichum higginsianum]